MSTIDVEEKIKLEVKNLNFYYGAFHALKSVNLSIPEKKVTAFIGPSGCGKSTLLRVFNKMFALYPEQRAEGAFETAGIEPGWQQERIANFQRHAMEMPKPGEPDLVCDFWTELNRNLWAQMAEEGYPQLSPEEFMAKREVVDYQIMDRFRRRADASETKGGGEVVRGLWGTRYRPLPGGKIDLPPGPLGGPAWGRGRGCRSQPLRTSPQAPTEAAEVRRKLPRDPSPFKGQNALSRKRDGRKPAQKPTVEASRIQRTAR